MVNKACRCATPACFPIQFTSPLSYLYALFAWLPLILSSFRAVASLSTPDGQDRNISSIFNAFSCIFSHFSLNFLHFLPHFGLPGGRLAHPGSPAKLRHCLHSNCPSWVYRWQFQSTCPYAPRSLLAAQHRPLRSFGSNFKPVTAG